MFFQDIEDRYNNLDEKKWTLIARFSSSDSKFWIKDGSFWYDRVTPYGNVNDPVNNLTMISTAFWELKGHEMKITRSDDSSHTALLQTTSNCLQGMTFRSKITSYGDFRNVKAWAADKCLGRCSVIYGGQYRTTAGFKEHSCSSDIQSSSYIGFWCDWKSGDGAVMMIGGGGSGCNRADHGIGITEKNYASFGASEGYNFGDDANGFQPTTYALNLWVR
ncbi:uncharacterized protein LOC114533435 [Dendronephthya gigantea]|uniref:uncharacterized protein LOC114533435 n=1 Tax=Dendronephthya gigantea TaxID=151771 RepID=UPI00106AA4C6|nr:uncharacterized protein LOC114533435 [Dendronephthya gigantea]